MFLQKRMEWVVVYCIFYAWICFTVEAISFNSEGSLDGRNALECHKRVKLNCKTDNKTVDIIFKINNSEVASCYGACYETPPIPDRYSITHNYSSGLICLQINSTSVIDEYNTFQCVTDGQTSEIKPVIKDFPQNETTTNITYLGDMSGIFTSFSITTGCIRHTESVYFVWKKTLTANGSVLESLQPGEFNQSNLRWDDTYCDQTKDCNASRLSNAITVNTDGSKLYYIHCTIVTNDTLAKGNVTRISDKPFLLKEIPITKPTPAPMPGFPIKYIIIICVIGPCCIAALGVVIHLLRKRTNRAVDAPDIPTEFQQGKVAEESATFFCIPGLYRPGRQELVLICHLVSESNKHMVEKIQQLTDDVPRRVPLMVNNLKQGSVYDCCVYSRSASSGSRRSENSETIRIKTLGLPDKPTQFQVLKVETNLIHLSWLPGEYRKGEQRFILEYTNMKTGAFSEVVIQMTRDIQLTYTIEPLTAGTTYEVSLHAENTVGVSETVGPIEVTTTGNPDPPTEFREVAVTHSSVTVSWKPGKYRRTTQTFIINYGKAKKNIQAIKWKQKKRDDDKEPIMTCTIDKLQPRTKYAIFVFAENDIGVSLPTKIIRSKTEEDKPENNVSRTNNGNNQTNHLIDMINSNV